MSIFTARYIIDFVNKTSHDKGGAYANENGAMGYCRILL